MPPVKGQTRDLHDRTRQTPNAPQVSPAGRWRRGSKLAQQGGAQDHHRAYDDRQGQGRNQKAGEQRGRRQDFQDCSCNSNEPGTHCNICSNYNRCIVTTVTVTRITIKSSNPYGKELLFLIDVWNVYSKSQNTVLS